MQKRYSEQDNAHFVGQFLFAGPSFWLRHFGIEHTARNPFEDFAGLLAQIFGQIGQWEPDHMVKFMRLQTDRLPFISDCPEIKNDENLAPILFPTVQDMGQFEPVWR